MAKVFTEITRLSEKDCFYIVERHKTEFTYPLHQHKEFEINFIEHGRGVRRIVGDSVEEIGEYELVLIGGVHSAHIDLAAAGKQYGIKMLGQCGFSAAIAAQYSHKRATFHC